MSLYEQLDKISSWSPLHSLPGNNIEYFTAADQRDVIVTDWWKLSDHYKLVMSENTYVQRECATIHGVITEEMAIRLAAYGIMKELAKEELISEEELNYIREKNQIPVE